AHLHADPAYANRLVRFLENHDEPRSAPAFAGRLSAAATIALSLPGMRFLFEGQLEGSEIRTPVQLGRWPAESPVPAIRGLYDRLLRSIDRELFHSGSWRLLDIRSAGDDSYADLVAHEWQLGSDRAVIAANIAGRDAQGLLQLSPLADGAAFDFVDQLTDNRYRWT